MSLTQTHSDTLVAVTTGPHVIFEAVGKRHRDENGNNREASVFQRLLKADFGNKVSTMKFLPNTETSCAFDCRIAVATKHAVKIYAPPPSNRCSSGTINNNNITLVADSENSTEVHNVYGTPITCMEVSGGSRPTLAVGLGSSTGLFDGYQVKLYDLSSGKPSVTFHGHTWYVSCMHLNSDSNEQPSQSSITLATGCGDRKVRLYDARCRFPVMTLAGHTQKISSVQADKWKIVSGGEDGVVTVWDIRMATRLWDWHNRHPVRLCRYNDRYLVVANVPDEKFVDPDNDGFADRKHRGSLQVYDFLCDDQQALVEALPDICRSSYDQLHGYDYGINLVTPYDTI
ncbi:F-box/WD repeat-containing protein 8 [Octopus bimaculoides]|nr:F-box/WD repeat-containing protein 8 [Octopus bimaculoides]|eukprot:XP_014772808.1 PREDICTED: F-box/WD repeat-containing protein 8-like [Octopus bimaculoides]